MAPPSRIADKFAVRLPPGMRADVETAAGEQFVSMNTFIVQAIAEKLDRDCKQELLLTALSSFVRQAQVA
jgi:predicted HicB family RNase H-like nuclease